MVAQGWINEDGDPSELAKPDFKTPESGLRHRRMVDAYQRGTDVPEFRWKLLPPHSWAQTLTTSRLRKDSGPGIDRSDKRRQAELSASDLYQSAIRR